MKYEISNEFLKVKADAEGAILWSVTDKDGFEYIWQGDDRYWNEHGANLFSLYCQIMGEILHISGEDLSYGHSRFCQGFCFLL